MYCVALHKIVLLSATKQSQEIQEECAEDYYKKRTTILERHRLKCNMSDQESLQYGMQRVRCISEKGLMANETGVLQGIVKMVLDPQTAAESAIACAERALRIM
jgi:NAD kinase